MRRRESTTLSISVCEKLTSTESVIDSSNMIEEIQADIFKVFSKSKTTTALVHGCNCFCTMNSGIAKEIRDKFPTAYSADCSTTAGDKNKLGTASFGIVDDNKLIFNTYLQFRYGHGKRYADYEAVYAGLTKVREACEASGIKTVLIPYKMASDRAGGDWRIVETMIRVVSQHFFDF
jgi:O-acetyl-ADP-ribose deacetylase (regulator of RNase III)